MAAIMSSLVEQVADAVPEVEQMFDMNVVDARALRVDPAGGARGHCAAQPADDGGIRTPPAGLGDATGPGEGARGEVPQGRSHRHLQPWPSGRGAGGLVRRFQQVLAAPVRWCSSISTTSSRSTIATATSSATRCWSAPPRCSPRWRAASDLVARYGGEEFVMVLPGCDAAGARVFCERLLDAFRREEFTLDSGNRLSVTVSMGVATHDDQERFDSAAISCCARPTRRSMRPSRPARTVSSSTRRRAMLPERWHPACRDMDE